MSEIKKAVLRGKPGELSRFFSIANPVVGCWRLADWGMSTNDLVGFLEKCIEMGLTTFDHADIYGDYTCEALFGQALDAMPALKQQCEIITKCNIKLISPNRPEHSVKSYDSSRHHIMQSVRNSLKALKVDRIDLLLLHRPDPLMDPESVAHAFEALKQSGDVVHFGLSNHSAAQFDMLASYLEEPLITNQVQLSVLDHQVLFDGTFDHALQHRYRPMVWSPLAGGALFNAQGSEHQALVQRLSEIGQSYGDYDASQVALSWVTRHPCKPVPVLGTGKIERIQQAVDARQLQLSREHWFDILQHVRGREVD